MVADDRTGATQRSADAAPMRRASPAKTARPGLFARLARFLRQIVDELRKVVRPTRPEWMTYTTVVIAFVVTIMVFVFALDSAFTRLVFWVFAG
ncbi:Protein translocase subunit SecE [Austwickia sp. TVS 96-490-7B]|uniref:preprotein translocase subunit SecE n=1 Tax=Austwickia sp. TVS 96-490-7B TaxID=2830843 RepID=UPI001D39F593|nr:preprotein translocase subunit SecE [Austwickia sp. TVS 96-490-7B]MBW3085706.1 Protein translocase subunit SecE [Austwickia sp. TVS 96-490-7B]